MMRTRRKKFRKETRSSLCSVYIQCVAVCAVILLLVTGCAAQAGSAQTACPEPPPVGNAYREWDGHTANYTCFPTYELTEGNLTRSCNTAANFTYTGSAPVCTLNCRYTRNETYATVVSINDTMALDDAIYECSNNTVGSPETGIYCSNRLGAWNYSAIDCHGQGSLIRDGEIVLLPMPSGNSTVDSKAAADGSYSSYVTMSPDSSLIFNISEYEQRMEVTSINVTLMVNFNETYAPCRVTRKGLEYNGTKGTEFCQKWSSQTPHQHNFTQGAMFPADGTVAMANNYCRNPDNRSDGPWCLSETGAPCKIAGCAQLTIKTIYIGMHGREQTSVCSGDKNSNHFDLLNNVGVKKTRTFGCRNSHTGVLPFGHSLELLLSGQSAYISVNVYEVQVLGRPHTEGCGPVRGYWGLQLEGEEPNHSALWSTVTYRCQDGWHYRGGSLESICTDSRVWSEPDLSQCTDDPNYASGLVVHDPGAQTASALMGNCIYPINLLAFSVFSVTVNLTDLVEVSEVLIDISDIDENTTVAVNVSAQRGNRSRPCESILSVGSNGTYRATCPFRPVSDRVFLQFNISVQAKWKICDIKVMGRQFTSALGCLQTEDGREYKGELSRTVTGRECQRWDSQVPHAHSYNSSDYFPDFSIQDAGNYCRNPSLTGDTNGLKQLPWCYISDLDEEWEFCFVQHCELMCRLREDGIYYRGDISVTASGTTCSKWEANRDRVAGNQFQRGHYFSETDNNGKRCRNPHASQTLPWCFTSGSSSAAELCDIPACPLAQEIDWEYLDPNNNANMPAWLNDSNLTVRECWRSRKSKPSDTTRLTKLSDVLTVSCTRNLLNEIVFCDLVTANRSTIWSYFWYNCSFPEDTTVSSTSPTSTSTSTSTSVSSTSSANTANNNTTIQSTCRCHCRKVCEPNVTSAELQEVVKQIKKELLVDTSKLSATIRKKTSAQDDRPSAVTTGSVGIIIIILVIGFIVSMDVISLIHYISKRRSLKNATKI